MLTKTDIEKQLITEEIKKINCSLRLDLRFPICKDYLVCETLWVRPRFPGDYIDMVDCFSSKEVMKYVGCGTTYDSNKLKTSFLNTATKNLLELQTSFWSIITHDGLAGCFYTHNLQKLEIQEKIPEIEIAFVMHPSFSGRGIMTEAGRLILNSKFTYPNFKGKIIATVHPNNKASQRVLEKLGLKPDPNKQNVPMYGSVRNYYEYSTSKVSQEIKPAVLHAFRKFEALLKCIDADQEKRTQKVMTSVRNNFG